MLVKRPCVRRNTVTEYPCTQLYLYKSFQIEKAMTGNFIFTGELFNNSTATVIRIHPVGCII